MKGLQPEVVLFISNITKSIKDYDWHDFVTENAWVLMERVEKKNREFPNLQEIQRLLWTTQNFMSMSSQALSSQCQIDTAPSFHTWALS